MDPNNRSILQIQAAFGGMAPVTKLALQTTKALEGRQWNEELLDEVVERLAKEFELPPGVSFDICAGFKLLFRCLVEWPSIAAPLHCHSFSSSSFMFVNN